MPSIHTGSHHGEAATASGAPVRPPSQAATGLVGLVRDFVSNNWKVAFYVLLIVLCVLFAPEAPLKFIYTEF